MVPRRSRRARLCLSSFYGIATLALFASIAILGSSEAMVKDFAATGVCAGVWMIIVALLPLTPPDSVSFSELFSSSKRNVVALTCNGIISIIIGIAILVIEPSRFAGTVSIIAAMAPLCAAPVLMVATYGEDEKEL